MAELGKYLEQFTYEELLRTALARVPDELDKRQGSIIYDALAPACYVLAEAYLNMRQIYNDTYVESATGDYLERRVYERGITRNTATKAMRRGVFQDAAGAPVAVVPGTRFSSMGNVTYTYVVMNELAAGEYELQCEQPGTGGNGYIGDILPITYIAPLAVARLTDIIIPGEDIETDEDLRARYLEEIGVPAFAGNIAAYDKMLKGISGVGEVQVYPVWDGGGTVKLSVVDSTFAPANPAFLDILQATIDPENFSGEGMGLAPIGHKVTVTAPAGLAVDVTATVTLKEGSTLAAAQAEAAEEIRIYIESVAKAWGTPDALNNYRASIYTAQIAAAILRSPSVGNATSVLVNGSADDLMLTQSAELQQIPLIGTVTLNAG
jgi:uncharacterized phage protein gp47/JayE